MTILIPNDEALVKNLRRRRRYRRPLGATCLILGVIGTVLLYYMTNLMQAQFRSDWELIAEMSRPTTQPAENGRLASRIIDVDQRSSNFNLGLEFGAGLVAAVDCALYGLVYLLIPSRSDRLLLQCWDKLHPSAS